MKIWSCKVIKNVVRVAGIFLIVLKLTRGVEGFDYDLLTGDTCTAQSCNSTVKKYPTWTNSDDDYRTICRDSHIDPAKLWHRSFGNYQQAEDRFQEREREILQTEEKTLAESSKALRSARAYYKLCDNVGSIANNTTDLLISKVNSNPIGSWPIMHAAPERRYKIDNRVDWWQILDKYYLAIGSESAFFDFSNTVNHEKHKHVLILAPSKLLIPHNILKSLYIGKNPDSGISRDKQSRGLGRQRYMDYIDDTLIEGFDTYRTGSAKLQHAEMDKMIDFEIALSEGVDTGCSKENLMPLQLSALQWHSILFGVSSIGTLEKRPLQVLIPTAISQPEKPEKLAIPLGSSPILEDWQIWYMNQSMYHDLIMPTTKLSWKESPLLHIARGLQGMNDPCKINWEMLIYDLWTTFVKTDENLRKVTDESIKEILIHVKQKSYHLKLCVLLRTTAPETIINYVNWVYYRNGLIRTADGAKKFEKLASDLGLVLKPRWRTCVEENVLKAPVYQVLMREQLEQAPDYEENIRRIYRDILNSLANHLILQRYYRQNSEKIIDDHVKKMSINIFGDKDPIDNKSWDTNVPASSGESNYLEEYFNHQKWRMKSILEKICEEATIERWPINPDRAAVLVINSEPVHQLYIPGAILQKPFYDPEQKDLLNYAGLGAEIATALWHSAVFPTIFPYFIHTWVETCFPRSLNDARMDLKTEVEIYKISKQRSEAVSVALEAYNAIGRYHDAGKTSLSLDHELIQHEEQLFIMAYLTTQCRVFKNGSFAVPQNFLELTNVNTDLDEIGLRDTGMKYALSEFSRSEYDIDIFVKSEFFRKKFRLSYDVAC